MKKDPLTVVWKDGKRDPQCPPNPDFPNGVVVDMSGGAHDLFTCSTELEYPAPRCGVYIVTCAKCGLSVGVTTAGRPDDPKEIIVACRSYQ